MESSRLSTAVNTRADLQSQDAGSLKSPWAAGVAGVLVSLCCIGPLVLITIGLGGAWVSSLQMFEPLRPAFIGVAVVALAFAYRGIFKKPQVGCAPGEVCALPAVRLGYQVSFWVVAAIVLLGLTFPYFVPLLF